MLISKLRAAHTGTSISPINWKSFVLSYFCSLSKLAQSPLKFQTGTIPQIKSSFIPASMGTYAEGLYTVETKGVSQLAPQGRINEELLKLKSFERMYYIKYGPFSLGDCRWEIRLYPVGEFVWYYLCLLDDAVPVKKYGYMSLVQDHNNNGDWKIDTWIKLNEEMDFKKTPLGEGLGLPMVPLTYFTKEDQEQYSIDDCLVHRFLLWVIFDGSRKLRSRSVRQKMYYQSTATSADPAAPSTVAEPDEEEMVILPPSDLISTLLETGDFADIIFVIKSETFPAHRCVLAARSPVFRSELLALQKDMDSSMKKLCVTVNHMDALTFKFMLHYIYTDALPDDFEDATPPERYHRMFVAAHRFQLDGLKLFCEKKLTKLVADTLITAFDFSEYHECGHLKVIHPEKKQETISSTVLGTKEEEYPCDSSCTTEESVGEESK